MGMGCCRYDPAEVRCSHCGIEYVPHHTGVVYCPTCERVVEVALQAVPRKWRYGFWPVIDPTFETALEWQKAQARERQKLWDEGKVTSKKVAVCLFDMEDPDNRNNVEYVRGRDKYQGIEYLVSSWSKRGAGTVSRRCWKNLDTGELRDK